MSTQALASGDARAGGLSAIVLRSVDDVAASAGEWTMFLDTASAHSVFQHPAYVLAQLQTRPEYEPSVVLVRDADTLVAVLPGFVQRERTGLRLSVLGSLGAQVRVLKVFGSGVVFAREADRMSCVRAALAALDGAGVGQALVVLDELEIGSETWLALEAAGFRVDAYRLQARASRRELMRRIDFPENYEAYQRSLSGNARNLLKRRHKKLVARFDGDLRLECVTAAEQLGSFLDQVDRVFRRTWQATAFGQRPRNSSAAAVRYGRMARAGWLRSYVLIGGGEPLAFVIGLQFKGVFHYLETGYDQGLSAFAPGLVLQHLMIADLFAHQAPRVLNFGYGDNQQKRMFANAHSEACEACLVRGWQWRALLGLQRTLDATEVRTRGLLATIGAASAVRRLLKRGAAPASTDQVQTETA